MTLRFALPLAAFIATGLKAGNAPQLDWAERAHNASSGSEVAETVTPLPLREREERLFREIIKGNVPHSSRTLKPVAWTNGLQRMAVFVTADYLAVGNDTNAWRIPLTPMTAQRVADHLDCSLPTPALVDAIWQAAEIKLSPAPMPPGPAMTSVPAFHAHHASIEKQLGGRTGFVAGHKKDVVAVQGLTNRVAIYGWHQTNGVPIQPLYTRHSATWVDYSHGIRLVSNHALLDGKPVQLHEVLPDVTRHSKQWVAAAGAPESPAPRPTGSFGEWETEFTLPPEVRVRLNLPQRSAGHTNELLVLFALPNGNTIEQSAGRQPHNTNEWRYNIQHIAAQIRFVRAALPETRIGVAYLEANGLSWPAWRKRHGNESIPHIVQAARSTFSTNDSPFVLSAHSGGGSFVFGYLAAVTNLSSRLERVAFLDATYGYDPALHHEKLVHWLKRSEQSRLTVIAYEDHVALLNGAPFVSAAGGTWGKSHRLLEDLRRDFSFTSSTNDFLQTHLTARGRVEFQLRENPEQKIWHTVLVERNGLIHPLLSGTAAAEQNYQFMGSRCYDPFILP